MPPRVTRIVRARKPHRESPKVLPWTPSRFSDELVKSRVEHGAVYRLLERPVTVLAKSDDGPRPGGGIIGLAWQVAPEDGAAFLGKLPGKGSLNFDKPVADKLIYLRVRERAWRFIGRHEIPRIAWPAVIARSKRGGRPIQF
jgi:hypothetical protein